MKTGNGTVNGTLTATAFYQSSDERLKTFYDEIPVDFEKLTKLRKSYFKYNDNEKMQIGVSAQEVNELYPEIIHTNKDGYKSVDYSKLSVVALKAIDILVEENKELKEKISEMEARLVKLEKLLNS